MIDKNKISEYHLDIYNSLIDKWEKLQEDLDGILKEIENDDAHLVGKIDKSYKLLLETICLRLNIIANESTFFKNSQYKDSEQLAIERRAEMFIGLKNSKTSISKTFGNKSEFEKEKDYMARCSKMEKRFNVLMNEFDVKSKPIIIKYFTRFENEISKIKGYHIDLKKYYSEPEHLNVGLTKPELDYYIKRKLYTDNVYLGTVKNKFPYRVKIKGPSNEIRIKGYNYFVKIPISDAEKNVNDIRSGKFKFRLSFKIRDGSKKIEDILNETIYNDTINENERKKITIPGLGLNFNKFELIDTVSNKTFDDFKEGDHHIDRNYRFV